MASLDLSGKVAVVTGGGQGIGEGIAKGFAEHGAAVVVAARSADKVERVAAEINDAGGRALAMPTDVTDRGAVEALADAAVETFGGLNIWVNNAGGSPLQAPLRELSQEDWDHCLTLNLTALWFASVIAADRMSSSGSTGCSIINVTSPAAEHAVPGSGHYSAAKAGVNALTKTMSVEFAPDIRVNGLAPGYVPTEVMMKALRTDVPALEQMAQKRIPLKRLGTPDDMASCCVYLASDAASWVTGQTIKVAGGS